VAEKRQVAGTAGVDKIINAQTGLKTSKYPDLPVNPVYVNVAEAADMAGVTRQYVHLSIPDLPSAQTISGFLHFERRDIERWITERADAAEAKARAREARAREPRASRRRATTST
jgi:hypothetical protein